MEKENKNYANSKIRYPELGKRLVELRRAKGLKQRDLVIPLGEPTLQMICSWEKGYSFPSFNYLRNISKFYNVSLDYLILGIKKEAPRYELTMYSEVFNAVAQLIDSEVFDLFCSDEDEYRNKGVSLYSIDNLVLEFCSKYKRLKNSKDLYGETKYQQALDELIASYKEDITKF